MPRVEIRGLCKAYMLQGRREPLPVLNALSIEAGEQEFVCLLGPSGCGKSTLLDILAQITLPDAGTILVDGSSDYRRYTFGYVFQRPRLLNWMTVRENLYFALRARGVPREEWRRRTDHYLALVGIADFADEYPLTLSGGMQQRVSIARALVIEPDILLMDEPFSSLDELTARVMRVELLRIWQATHKTVFFVTHNPFEAAYLADRIYLLSPRPATVVREIRVGLPRPRDMDDPALLALQKEVVGVLLSDGIMLETRRRTGILTGAPAVVGEFSGN